MAITARARQSLIDYERAIAETDSSAFLVSPRIIRRVIRHERQLTGIVFAPPHCDSYVVRRAVLLQYVDDEELGLDAQRNLPDRVILLARPPVDRAAETRERTLLRLWRQLFHARVDAAYATVVDRGALGQREIRRRIDEIGQIPFDEIRAVLRHEDRLLPPVNDRAVYTEFAALFLELRNFVPHMVSRHFPTIEDPERVEELLRRDVDVSGLRAATRPPGAPDPESAEESGLETRAPRRRWWRRRPRPVPDYPGRLFRHAGRRATSGNNVRAAILYLRAAEGAVDDVADTARRAAAEQLDALLERLEEPLELSKEAAQAWRPLLRAAAGRARHGARAPEGRLLYDLQRVCVDHERGISTVDLVDWARSMGRRPARRDLPGLQESLISRHLRRAKGRIHATRLEPSLRERLEILLGSASEAATRRMRHRFGPLLDTALRQAGLESTNLPEEVARRKLVRELLDRIEQKGFLAVGDARDALSRNQLKLPDVRRPGDLFGGDRLLALNRALRVPLEGVYRPAEFYMRWLQRFSALVFGTVWGRGAVRYAALPLGGAFLILVGLQEMIGIITNAVWGTHIVFYTPISFLLLGGFLFCCMHLRGFGRSVVRGLRAIWRGLGALANGVYQGLLNVLLVRRILSSHFAGIFRLYFVKPLLYTVIAWFLLRIAGSSFGEGWTPSLPLMVLVFSLFILLLNSLTGRTAEEYVVDRVGRSWNHIRLRIFYGAIQMLVQTFRRVLDTIERVLYIVDEWLRFRGSESRLGRVVKPVLGVIWYVTTYLIRIYLNLLIEPQINPVKHFPVVTVSHKMLLPMAPQITAFFAGPLTPLIGETLAGPVAFSTVFLLPGVFGFLVWELKENWKLFAANRPEVLKPVMVGHHGERMIQLMRPGFHSGTLPRLYSRLRRSDRRNRWTGELVAPQKYQEGIARVEHEVQHFIERELFELLAATGTWAATPVAIGHVAVGSNSIRVELSCPTLGLEGLELVFEEQSGWLLARVARRGWLDELGFEQAVALSNVLAGLYKSAGVDLVREQVEAELGPQPPAYDVSRAGLVVWPGRGYDRELAYDLAEPDATVLHAVGPDGETDPDLPPLDAQRVLYRKQRITWDAWVETWSEDQAGGTPPLLIPTPELLPRRPVSTPERPPADAAPATGFPGSCGSRP